MNRKAFMHLLGGLPLLGALKSLATPKTDCKTQKDAEGPFYKTGAPLRSVIETHGQPLKIRGRVYNAGDCLTPISDAVIDIWHCDAGGEYDMHGYKGRGRITTDQSGNYSFTTIYPPPYGNRPRHIHFKIKVPGHPELTTQLYFEGDPNIQNDFARNATANRIIALTSADNVRAGVFDIYI